jgi:hypothetical protein
MDYSPTNNQPRSSTSTRQIENTTNNIEQTDVKIKLEISNLEKRLADLNEKLSYSKFNLEKLHCDLIMTLDPEFLINQKNVEIKCEKCLVIENYE